jgi:hypothetical protein
VHEALKLLHPARNSVDERVCPCRHGRERGADRGSDDQRRMRLANALRRFVESAGTS